MNSHAFCLFETAFGVCGIAWREEDGAVSHFQFPERKEAQTYERLLHCSGGREKAPPAIIENTIEKIRRHLTGEVEDFLDVQLSLESTGVFRQRVYEYTRKISPGSTLTYGAIAKAVDQPGAARAVGYAMGSNPIPLLVPCHRVVAAGGRAGGFSAPGGLSTKEKLLRIEGVVLGGTLSLDF